MTTLLSSKWDGLSPTLIAEFYEIERDNSGVWYPVSDDITVRAPLTESNFEASLNWQSPFENAGPESKAPTLFAMLQSGAIQPLIDALNISGKSNEAASLSAQQKSSDFLKQFEGRTGITKLNSTQVFNGMPPVKIQVTAMFRAWDNSSLEVSKPLNQLMAWALPKSLSKDGSILARAVNAAKGEADYVSALLPSLAPVQIAMKYKRRTYKPLVIESISHNMNSASDANGDYTELLVNMTLCTLTAIDGADWNSYE